MNCFSNSIPNLAELVVKNRHIEYNPIKEPSGLAKELNFRSHYLSPYVTLATLSITTGLSPNSLKKVIPFGILVLIALWVLSLSLSGSKTIATLVTVLLVLSPELTIGLVDFSQFSFGLFFALLFFSLYSKSLRASERLGSSEMLLGILLLVGAHFSHYTAELDIVIYLLALVTIPAILRRSRAVSLYSLLYSLLLGIVLFCQNPIIYDAIRFTHFSNFGDWLRQSSSAFGNLIRLQAREAIGVAPTLGSRGLVITKFFRVILMGILALLFGIKSVLRKDKENLTIFLALGSLIVVEQLVYVGAGFAGPFTLLRNYWLFAPLLATLFLFSLWKHSARLKWRIPAILLLCILLLSQALGFYQSTAIERNVLAYPDIKHWQRFTPVCLHISKTISPHYNLFSTHDLIFLAYLEMAPEQSRQLYLIGRRIDLLDESPCQIFEEGSILLLSSYFENQQPIYAQRGQYVHLPLPGLFKKLNECIYGGKIYDDGVGLIYISRK